MTNSRDLVTVESTVADFRNTGGGRRGRARDRRRRRRQGDAPLSGILRRHHRQPEHPRGVLSRSRPTLVLHRKTDVMVPIDLGRRYVEGIPGAEFIEYPGSDHVPWVGDLDALAGDIEEFVTGRRETEDADIERILATVLFTDIVDSTRKAAEAGDRQWRCWLDEHDRIARQTVEKHRGRWIKSTGDGLLATFDGPGRAVRCAFALGPAVRPTGLSLRAGLHTGEIELRGDDVGGLAVHLASRVTAQSEPGEVWVSRVVTELTVGAGLKFAERGARNLKGIPGTWELFAATA